MTFDLPPRLVAEALGAALLVGTVVGSGIMADGLTIALAPRPRPVRDAAARLPPDAARK